MNIDLTNITKQKKALLWAISDAFAADDLDRVDALDDTLDILIHLETYIENRPIIALGAST